MSGRAPSPWLTRGALLVVLGVIIWSLFQRDADLATPATSPRRHLATSPDPPGEVTRDDAARLQAPLVTPLVLGVRADRERLCLGEQVMVEVELAATLPAGAEVFVNGKPGPRVLLFAAQPGPLEALVTLHVPGQREPELAAASFVVEPCHGAPRVTLSMIQSVTEEDTFLFEARATRGLSEPIRWTWDFGDGSPPEEGESSARHDYRLRAQHSRQSRFLVRVQGEDGEGRRASALAEVTLTNSERALSERGMWQMPVWRERFPRVEGGVLRATIRARNIDEERALRLDEVEVRATSCEERDAVEITRHAPHRALGFDEILAGEQVEGELVLPVSGACRWQVVVRGELEDGTPARLDWAMEHGAPKWAPPSTDREAIKRALRDHVARGGRHVLDEVSASEK